MHYKQTAKKLCVMLTVLLTGLALKGCGDIDSGPSSGPSTSLKIAVVYNPSQAAPLTQREATLPPCGWMSPGRASPRRTASSAIHSLVKQVDISINAPAGSDRTIYLAALDAANQLLFSGSVSGVTIPASGPIPITVVLPFRVVISKQGGGSGTVTASPSGFACGANCFDFDGGTSVTLTASADPGSVFAGWSGGGCSGTGACTVNTDATIAAHLQCCRRHRHRDGDEDGLGHRHRDQYSQRHCLWRLLFGQFCRRDLCDPDRRWQWRINIRRLERRL